MVNKNLWSIKNNYWLFVENNTYQNLVVIAVIQKLAVIKNATFTLTRLNVRRLLYKNKIKINLNRKIFDNSNTKKYSFSNDLCYTLLSANTFD